jgi:excisionase family DNA binding protein
MAEQIVNIKTRDVAGIAQVDDSTVRRWAEEGTIPGAWKTPGGHWRFDQDLVLARFGNSAVSS